ncbi:MAG: AAA family ATPase [Acidobacteria bacterium]|nr:AAA family ATPase [Acidobacteriota bacterium]MCB9398153.1 AAA family ATPase [Acidobacteriota bacterium]
MTKSSLAADVEHIANPKALYEGLSQTVIDQTMALEQICVSLYKHLKGIKVGNILLIGNSGTGKTTIMRAIENLFRNDPRMARFTNTIRLNANVVATGDSVKPETSVIIERLHQNALQIMGDEPNPDVFKMLMEHGVVFIDEVDKIRSKVGDSSNSRGILAQEALLTLIEGEVIELPLVRKSGGQLEELKVSIDTSRILFICGGAFEGLYDMVYRRVASGEHKDKLVQEYVISDQREMEEKEHFSLSQYVRYEDMFEYGMTPQFLGRFDEIIVLNELTPAGLMRIFLEPPDSIYREAQRYFKSLGIELQITREALQLLADRAFEQHRIGARALRSLFKRITRGLEFDPDGSYMVQEKDGRRMLTITRDLVDRLS